MRTRTTCTRAAMLLLLIPLLLVSMSSVAHAALISRGPLKTTVPGQGYPMWYQDDAGVALELNLTPGQLLDPPNPAFPDQVARGFGPEAFYWMADSDPVVVTNNDATVGEATLILGLEAVGPVPGDVLPPDVFFRVRVIADGLTANTSYTFTHPYGSFSATSDAAGSIQNAGNGDPSVFTAPLPFDGAVITLGPFMVADPAAPAGFIGNPAAPSAATVGIGGPPAVFTVSGGGNGSTNQWTMQGKLFTPTTVPLVVAAGGASVPAGGFTSQPAVSMTFSTLHPNTVPVPVQFSVDGGPTQNFAGLPIAVTGERMHTVQFRSVTPTGGVEPTQTVTFGMDATAPTMAHAFTPGKGQGTFWLSAADALSGVSRIAYQVDNGAEVSVTGAAAAIPITPGQHTVTFSAFDALGQRSALQTVTVNQQGKPNLTLPKVAPTTPRRNRTFTLSGKIGHADVGNTRVSFVIQRRVGRRWVKFRTVNARLLTGKKTFSVKTKIARAGTFRVRAEHAADAVHIKGVSKFKTFRVR